MAGLGTRFLPATKAIPKEMLPVVDKPLIQYAVEEALEAGISTLILVTRGDKQAITDHLRPSSKLEQYLSARDQLSTLEAVNSILPPNVTITEVIQAQPLGLGHAVWCARDAVGEEAFAVILPDDLVRSQGRGCLAQLLEMHAASGASVVGVERIEPELSGQYGIASVEPAGSGMLRMTGIVEKPRPADARSDLGVVGRYVLTPSIFTHLENLVAGAGGEIQLTDAIAALLKEQPVMACAFTGRRFDCGQRLGLVQATLALALDDPELAAPLQKYLGALLASRRGQG